MKEIKKFSITLFIICVTASFCLSVVYALTKPQIEKQKTAEESQSLQEVLPQAKNFNPVTKGEEILYYEAKDGQGNTVGYAFKAFGKGYSSTIETIVGITPDGKISNIKILSQNETPGLGSRIVEIEDNTTVLDKIQGKQNASQLKPKFQAQFSAVAIQDLDKLDTISGATISSEAVIKSIREKSREILELIEKKE